MNDIDLNKTLTIVTVYNLEVLNGRLCDPTVEVQHIGLSVLVPDRCLVVELDNVAHVFSLGLLYDCTMFL